GLLEWRAGSRQRQIESLPFTTEIRLQLCRRQIRQRRRVPPPPFPHRQRALARLQVDPHKPGIAGGNTELAEGTVVNFITDHFSSPEDGLSFGDCQSSSAAYARQGRQDSARANACLGVAFRSPSFSLPSAIRIPRSEAGKASGMERPRIAV